MCELLSKVLQGNITILIAAIKQDKYNYLELKAISQALVMLSYPKSVSKDEELEWQLGYQLLSLAININKLNKLID